MTKNQNGACIKLTGLQGADLTEQQLSLVHQQVKQQLVKKGKENEDKNVFSSEDVLIQIY